MANSITSSMMEKLVCICLGFSFFPLAEVGYFGYDSTSDVLIEVQLEKPAALRRSEEEAPQEYVKRIKNDSLKLVAKLTFYPASI